ncbi:terminase [Mycobacterium marinum]|uniref:terminase n=1 Tax=Mycobacterium marinum TaxID=1781 RepID=UPI0020CCE145|nr:terminase [Mycobacterium marinum]
MMVVRLTTGSTRRLSEVARHLVIPEGIVTSVFPRVERRLASVGVGFDEWQRGLGQVALGCRADGKYAATVGGVSASIPRQVGKTFWGGRILVGLALEFPELKVAWTSHHNRTTMNTFRSIQGFVRKKAIYPLLDHTSRSDGIRATNGEQEIRFRNGSLLMFGAREQGFGRGLDELDVEVFDEAQILTLKALEDMVPATNQARHPHGGLIFFFGTPPRPMDPGEAFTAKREQALGGNPEGQVVHVGGDGVWLEIGAAPDARVDDRSQWPVMNPSFPHRTPVESMLRMRANIPDDDAWRREAMGIWPSSGGRVFDLGQWALLGNSAAVDAMPGHVVLAVAVAPDRSWSCIGVAGEGDSGRTVVLCFSMPGVSSVAKKVAELSRVRGVDEVVLAGAQARLLQPDLVRVGVDFVVLSSSDMGAGCAAFQVAVADGLVEHADQSELNVAVANAKTRFSGESEVWDRRDPRVDDSPLVACSAAFYRWGLLDSPVAAIY